MDSTLKKNNAVILSLLVSVTTAVLLLVCMISINMTPASQYMLTAMTLPAVLALYLAPRMIQKFLSVDMDHCFFRSRKDMITIALMAIFSVAYGFLFMEEFGTVSVVVSLIVHYLFVSLGEEFTYRGLILNILSEKYGKAAAVVISALMFAFILHINESMLINLLIRFPLGLILGIVSVKKKCLSYSIMLHTMYNLIVLIF